MKKIPDSVLTEAERIYGQLGQGVASDVNAIAQALLARDQRAAEIARNAGKFHLDAAKMGLSISPSPIIAKDRARIAQQIAASILSYDEAQQ